jgi:hypothetical protein
MGVQDYTENLKFLYEYLSETNYELAEKLSRFIRDGIGKPENLDNIAIFAAATNGKSVERVMGGYELTSKGKAGVA